MIQRPLNSCMDGIRRNGRTASPESVDAFLRNQWTECSGIHGLGPEYAQSRDGTIYVEAGGVFAFDPGGSVRWTYGGSSTVVTTPILGAGGTIYIAGIGRGGRGIHALDTQGKLLWDYPTDSYILGSPAIGLDGTILTTSSDRTVYGIVETRSTAGGFGDAPWPTARGDRANSGRAGG